MILSHGSLGRLLKQSLFTATITVSILILNSGTKAATIVVPPGGDFQAALNAAQCGDVVVLGAGSTYATSVSFTTPNKGPCTGTDADYITVQSSNPPPANTRANPASQSANFARIISTGGYGVLTTATGSHHYKFIGLEITTDGTRYTPDLVSIGPNVDGSTWQQVKSMKGFVIDRCFIHPPEINAGNLFPSTLARSAGRGIGLAGVDLWVTNSYIAGFAGVFPAGSNEPGSMIDSYGVYSVTGPGPIHIFNNYIEAQFNNIFLGGGDPGTSNTATVSNPTMTSATLSNVANLQVGDLVFYYNPIHHVGIYVGDNKIMHAPSAGDFVRMADMDGAGPIHSFGRPS